MIKETIREDIDKNLGIIAEQWASVRSYEQKMPLIELEILMEKIRHLYEDLSLIAKLNKAPGFDPEIIKSRIAYRDLSRKGQEPAVVQPVIPYETSLRPEVPPPPSILLTEEFAATDDSSDSFLAETRKEEAPEHTASQPVPDELEEIIKQDVKAETPEPEVVHAPDIIEEEKHQQTVTPKEPTPAQAPSLADKYQEDKKSIKDIYASSKDDNSIGQRLQQSQIADLKSGIGINDKFLFINELFKGDLAGYNKAIESLNHCGDRNQAVEQLEEIRAAYSWSEQSVSFRRFSDFLKRRYPE